MHSVSTLLPECILFAIMDNFPLSLWGRCRHTFLFMTRSLSGVTHTPHRGRRRDAVRHTRPHGTVQDPKPAPGKASKNEPRPARGKLFLDCLPEIYVQKTHAHVHTLNVLCWRRKPVKNRAKTRAATVRRSTSESVNCHPR